MPTVVVVAESCFGNTQQVARAIAQRIAGAGATVDVVAAADAPARLRADLVLVGVPTHNMGLPSAASRNQATSRGAGPAQPGVREWAERVEAVDGRVVTFATRTKGPFSGSGSKAAAAHLRRHGVPAERGQDFLVTGVGGPLAPGELDRAGDWGASLVEA